MFEYAIYDVTTGDCLETFIVEQDLGEEPEVEVKLVREITEEED